MDRENQASRIGVPYRTREEEVASGTTKIEKYLAAVRRAGGQPVPISLAASLDALAGLASSLDGVVLTGSPADVEPSRYGAPRHIKCAKTDDDRERIDFALLENCFAARKPVLAICYGIQSLNVFLSGTLIQDVPSEIGTKVVHSDDEEGAPDVHHVIAIESESRISRMAGAREMVVNSSHHQAILMPGRNLRVTARAPDGVIEAVEWTSDENWVVGVQWHPERSMESDSLAQSLFGRLVKEAAMRKAPAAL
ncbi:MAG TPA: gamma-glutamyl-gamma-aminobutyrate hydrolase family protein [Candidatus Acidoferrales bacterium]